MNWTPDDFIKWLGLEKSEEIVSSKTESSLVFMLITTILFENSEINMQHT